MTDYLIEVLFRGIDVELDDLATALGDAGVLTAEPLDDEVLSLSAVVADEDAVRAALGLVQNVMRAAPDAQPVSANRDLVGVTDIAERVGVTREAVRHWATGKRRAGNFPHPVGTAGDAKIWEWSSVHTWLRQNLGIWDELELPTHADYGLIDSLLPSIATPRREAARPAWHPVSPPAAGPAAPESIIVSMGSYRELTTTSSTEWPEKRSTERDLALAV